MTTKCEKDVIGGCNVITSDVDPFDAAKEAVMKPLENACVIINVKAFVSIDSVVKWIQKFYDSHAAHVREIRKDLLPPSVAVIANNLTDCELKQLREVGAVVFDQQANGDLEDPVTEQSIISALQLESQMEELDVERELPKIVVNKTPDPKYSNSFAPGVTEEGLQHFFDQLNKSPD